MSSFSPEILERLQPLIESTTERSGWQRFVEVARDLLSVQITTALEFVDDDRAVVRAGLGYPHLEVGAVLPMPPGSQADHVCRHEQPTVSNDLTTEARFAPSPFLLRDGVQSSMSMRIPMPNGQYAVIGAHSRSAGRFTDHDIRSFVSLGAVFASVIHRLRRWDELELSARVDPVTGLLNRSVILELLDAHFEDDGQPSLLLVDIDGFKAVNDTHGHRVGDAVLRIIARRIEQSLGPNDQLGRLGGDEFLLLSAHSSEVDDLSLAERLIGHVEAVIMVDAHSIQVSASVGVARRRSNDDAMTLLERSDRLMYAAKSAGRGQVRSDVAEDATPIRQRRPDPDGNTTVTAAMLDEAIDGLSVVAQPIIDPTSGCVHGIEALARGPVGHPLELPDVLFPAARTFSRLGDVELRAKRLAFALEIEAATMLYVNLEPVLLSSSTWMAELTAAWRETGAHPNVTVELTERAVLHSPGRLLRAVDVCRAHGWKIALDDIGSRSESLAALRWIDPDVVKLDMSLIARGNGAHSAHVASAVAAHRDANPSKQLRVIAEGVETPADAHAADILGADLLQGYLYGRPMPIDDLRRDDPEARRAPTEPPRRVDGERVATGSELLKLARHVESAVVSPDAVLLASVQRHDAMSERAREQYESLAKRCGFVGIVGVGVNAANVPHARGVRLADLEPNDPLRSAWQVVLLSPTTSVALLATVLDDTMASEPLYTYRITTDADEVEQAARRLLRYF